MTVGLQIVYLLVLALPVASIAWTVTHEEIFHEFHEYCAERSESCHRMWQRKFFYLFTCEFCFSHYVAIAVLLATKFQLLYTDWRGYVVAGFAVVWVANVYIAIFNRLRLDLRKQRAEIKTKEHLAEKIKPD